MARPPTSAPRRRCGHSKKAKSKNGGRSSKRHISRRNEEDGEARKQRRARMRSAQTGGGRRVRSHTNSGCARRMPAYFGFGPGADFRGVVNPAKRLLTSEG